MQEQTTEKTIALVIKASKWEKDLLKSALRIYLDHHRRKKQMKAQQPSKDHGKTSVKKLVGEGSSVSSIDVSDGSIKDFERVAKKYNIDFAVKKDKSSEPPKYIVFFKAKDEDVLSRAFREYVYKNEKKKSKVSIRQKLKQFRKMLSQDKNRERSREKNKNRGQTL